jgi:hypothetical protein
MSQIKTWNRVVCCVTFAAFSTSALVPHAAHALAPQAVLHSTLQDVQSGLKLARQTKRSGDVIEFIREDLAESDVRNIVALFAGIDANSLPTVSAQGLNIRFGKSSDEIPELRVIDAENGRFRWGKKELFIREGMSFEEFYSQFNARLEKDARTSFSAMLWELLVSRANAEMVNGEDVKIVPDHAPVEAPQKKGLSTGAKIAIAVGVVLVVALVAYLIYNAHKKSKEKEEAAAKEAAKNDEKEQDKTDAAKDYDSVKQAYDNARGEYEFRCGSYPTESLWSEGASQEQQVSAMKSATSSLASKPCATSTSNSSSTTSH